MSFSPEREPFIPIRVRDLIDLLCADRGPTHVDPLPPDDQIAFRRFADAATTYLHAVYRDQFNRLKRDYAPFDPDRDLIDVAPPSETDRAERLDGLIDRFADLLDRANYRRLTRPELETIMLGASEWGVDMHVPWDAYERIDVYVRGTGIGRRTRRKWYRLFRLQEVTVPTFERVVIILKQRPHKALGREADTRHVWLKLFKDIPTPDLEMLLPGTTIKMPLLDRLRLGGSGLSSIGYVAFKMQAMSAPMLKAVGLISTGAIFGEEGIIGLIALYTPLALIFGYAYRTYANFTTTKQAYQLQLSQSLYYQNLDNNAGVLFRLLDAAEEQEAREMLLAYFFLWRHAGEHGWPADQLDHYIELELGRAIGREVNFEIDDAVRKLEEAGAVVHSGDRLVARPIWEAIQNLHDAWERHVNPLRPDSPAIEPDRPADETAAPPTGARVDP